MAPDAAQLSVIEEISRASWATDGVDPLNEAARLALRHGRAERVWLIGEIGVAVQHRGSLHLTVVPAKRRRGLGRLLMATALTSGEVVGAWSHGDHPGAATLASEFGLRRHRELWLMRLPATRPLPDQSKIDGVSIRGFDHADIAELLRVNAAAFVGHEQGLMDPAGLEERMAEEWFEAADILVAARGDAQPPSKLLGFHWLKRRSDDLGEVYVVAVDPQNQSGGVGKALTIAGLYHLRTAGMGEIILYVDADNNAARNLYEGLGFTHRASDTDVEYTLPDCPDAPWIRLPHWPHVRLRDSSNDVRHG